MILFTCVNRLDIYGFFVSKTQKTYVGQSWIVLHIKYLEHHPCIVSGI